MDLPTLTAKDEDDLVQWGLPNDIDFIAASFVRKGSDLDYIRKVSTVAIVLPQFLGPQFLGQISFTTCRVCL